MHTSEPKLSSLFAPQCNWCSMLLESIETFNGDIFLEVLYFALVLFRDPSDTCAVWNDHATSAYLHERSIFAHIMNIWWQDAQCNNNKKRRGEKEEEKEKPKAVKSLHACYFYGLKYFSFNQCILGNFFWCNHQFLTRKKVWTHKYCMY